MAKKAELASSKAEFDAKKRTQEAELTLGRLKASAEQGSANFSKKAPFLRNHN